MMGVERQESNKRTKATSSRMVRGVAGLSNMARGGESCCALRRYLKPDETNGVQTCQHSAYDVGEAAFGFNPALTRTWQVS